MGPHSLEDSSETSEDGDNFEVTIAVYDLIGMRENYQYQLGKVDRSLDRVGKEWGQLKTFDWDWFPVQVKELGYVLTGDPKDENNEYRKDFISKCQHLRSFFKNIKD